VSYRKNVLDFKDTEKPHIMNYKKPWKSNRGRLFITGAIALIAIIIFASFRKGGSSDLPTYEVQRDQFVVSLTETGELRAINSVVITSPPVRGSLQIIYLAPKGEEVEEGDSLIVFDGTEWQKSIDEAQSKLEITMASFEKSKASMASTMAQLEASLKSSKASYEIAELRLEQMKFEAEVKRQEQELSLLQSKINLEQATAKIKQQNTMDNADLRTLNLQIKQAESNLEKARRDFNRLTIFAPQPGLVVYKKIWKGGDFAEIKIGDTPWRGQALIELPDLSLMEVETSVNEVDVASVKADQNAIIILDAFPDREFAGTVVEVSNLARIEDESIGEVKVFDVVIHINENDPILKPGMTVSSEIIIESVPDVLSVPIDAVFSDGDKKIVYREAMAGYKPWVVKLGIRNNNFVVVEEGLEEGQIVCLIDPTKPFDAESWGGDGSASSNNNGNNKSTGNKTSTMILVQ